MFECQGLFYYQINKKRIKTIQNNEEDTENKHKRNKKVKTSAYFSRLWSKRPIISLRRLGINYATTFDDIKDRALFDGSVMAISNSLLAANSRKIKIKDFELENIGERTKFSGAELECIMGLSLIKVFLFATYAMMIKRKYEVKT